MLSDTTTTLPSAALDVTPSGAAITLLATGLARHRVGDAAAAEQDYRAALDLAPHMPQALHLLGVLLTETRRAGEALVLLRQACLLAPGDSAMRLALARACAECGRQTEAIALLRAVLGEQPRNVGLMLAVAHLHSRAGDRASALAACREAVAAVPGDARVHAALAVALAEAGDHAAALVAADAALALDRRPVEAWLARGAALRALGRPVEAVAALEHAIALAPGHAQVLLALGNARADCGATDRAAELMRAAAERAPELAPTHASLAALLTEEGQLPEAIAAADAAIAADRGYAPGWWNRGVARLLAGDLAGGFADAEWRKQHPHFAADFAGLAGPEWRGGPLDGCHLLVHAGQGMGDTIMFARCLPALVARGARVTVACARAVVPLLAGIDGVHAVARADGLPPYESWVDQMSLPHLLGVDPIPGAGGYLAADPARVAAWRARLGAGARIGLVWAGNPAHRRDRHRSIPEGETARLLRPLQRLAGAVPRMRLVALQVGPRHGELAEAWGLEDVAAGLGDFAQTAALVAALDLVVTVDTAVAHLAGALGVPCWVMLPRAPDWRWQLGRPDSPWYSSVRLFRQPVAGDWNAVARAVAAALRVRFTPREVG
jgi:tetratricopeptide (TPR) repeat protein